MTDIASIGFAFYGFTQEQEDILKPYFANADKWELPWVLTEKVEEAKVVIVSLSPDDNDGIIEKLKQELPKAEIVAFSSKQSPQAKWHLERQTNGKVAIVAFSKLVLKITHSLKKNRTVSAAKSEATIPAAQQPVDMGLKPSATMVKENEEFEPDAVDMSSFFNSLDSLLDSKPNEKRKRFNEKD